MMVNPMHAVSAGRFDVGRSLVEVGRDWLSSRNQMRLEAWKTSAVDLGIGGR